MLFKLKYFNIGRKKKGQVCERKKKREKKVLIQDLFPNISISKPKGGETRTGISKEIELWREADLSSAPNLLEIKSLKIFIN